MITVEPYLDDFLSGDIDSKVERLISDFNAITNFQAQDFFKVKFGVNQNRSHYFDYISNSDWRDFLLSVYYADLLSYTKKEDQVDFPRLLYIVNSFPEGFTVWWARMNNKAYPVGYTGWYYVEKNVFAHIAMMRHDKTIEISNRFFLPAKEKTPYIYLFNYSIAPPLTHSAYSRALIKNYAEELSALQYDGLFCATVSDDGRRVAEQFNMRKIGAITAHENAVPDSIYFYLKEH
ncbi:MAG: hypothetical protein LBD79_06720 [Treponema sp.]|nr:hypothetical protein [Treponema sp.]